MRFKIIEKVREHSILTLKTKVPLLPFYLRITSQIRIEKALPEIDATRILIALCFGREKKVPHTSDNSLCSLILVRANLRYRCRRD